ncbi:hypothetical protein DFH07DRAFT_384701 [Mycena maculata]|uniref:Uncharacterized protein n=1 Tax=Mycena maculata TaxID=230809 RepID=A0AAD7JG01_9AGAR|nr:hypothetical protein DFH07DRAFT_384701 [Mycena maculata]
MISHPPFGPAPTAGLLCLPPNFLLIVQLQHIAKAWYRMIRVRILKVVVRGFCGIRSFDSSLRHRVFMIFLLTILWARVCSFMVTYLQHKHQPRNDIPNCLPLPLFRATAESISLRASDTSQ